MPVEAKPLFRPDVLRPHLIAFRIWRRSRDAGNTGPFCPIEDRRQLDSTREGMLKAVSLGGYFLLGDYTGRLFRDGKATISAEVLGILERLGSN